MTVINHSSSSVSQGNVISGTSIPSLYPVYTPSSLNYLSRIFETTQAGITFLTPLYNTSPEPRVDEPTKLSVRSISIRPEKVRS